MSYPPPQAPSRPLRLTPPLPQSQADSAMPPLVEKSPKLPGPSNTLTPASSFILPGTSKNQQQDSSMSSSSAQRYLRNREQKKLFDSADYFSTSPSKRTSSPLPANGSAFEQVEYEANRLGQEPRASALSFELFTEVEGGSDISSDDEDGQQYRQHPVNSRKPTHNQQHSMRRGSLEEFFVEENEHETVKHAILEKPKLKRWDSGDFYSSPTEYRKMLATQAKEVLRKALDHAEAEHRPVRRRRSSLSMSETHSIEE